MALELATAYVPIVPSMRGAQRHIARELNQPAVLGAVESSGRSMGSRIIGGIGKTMKAGATVAAVGVGGVLSTAIVKGFGRLSAIENAEAKLKGLGNSGEVTSEIMANALASVKGTAFGMDEAATTAASAVAAGIQPGKDLTRYLGLVGDAATIAGTDMASMGAIFNKVAITGKVQGDTFQQLGSYGIPIISQLADTLGVTSEEVYDLGSKGQISAAQFLDAVSAMEGAALAGGNTTTGAFKNMGAALSRFGAALLADLFPHIGPVFNRITDGLDAATEKVGPFAEAVGSKVGPALNGILDWAANIDFSSWHAFTDSLAGEGAGDAVGRIGNSLGKLRPILDSVVDSGRNLGSAFADLAPIFPRLAESAGSLAVTGLELLAGGLEWVADNSDTIVKFIPAIVAGFVAWRVASVALAASSQKLQWVQAAMAPVLLANNTLRLTAIILENRQTAARMANTGATAGNTVATATNTTAQNAGVLAKTRSAAALVAQRVAMVATTIATRAMAAGQWLLNAALTANPIGIVVMALVGLGVAVVAAYKNIGWFRDGVDTAWSWIKRVTGSVFGWIKDVAFPAFRSAIVTTGSRVMAFYHGSVKPAFDWAQAKIGSFVAFFGRTRDNIGNMIGSVKRFFTGMYHDGVRPAMDWVGNKIRDVWGSVKRNALDPLNRFVGTTIPDTFRKAVDGIGTIWDGLKKVVGSPVSFVVKDLINGVLVAGYNRLNDFWSGKDLDPMPVPRGFRTGGRTGGVREDEVRGLVHGKEVVLDAPTTRDLDRKHPGLIDDLLQRGAAALSPLLGHEGEGRAHSHQRGAAAGGPGGPGTYLWGPLQNRIYASGRASVSGGAPGYDMGAAVRAWNNMSNLKVNRGSGPNQIRVGSGAPAGTWGYAWSDGRIQLNPNIPGNMKVGVAAHEIGHVLGLDHAGTNSIMHPQMRGPLWPSAYDRQTIQRIYGGAGNGNPPEGGGRSMLSVLGELTSNITEPFKKALGELRERFRGNGWVDAGLGIAGKVKDGLIEFGMNKLKALPDFINDAVGKIKGLFGLGAVGPHMVPELHDNGGLLFPGRTMVENRTRKPEAVLNPEQTQMYKKGLSVLAQQADARPATILQVEHMFGTPKEIVNEVERRARRATAARGIRHTGKVTI